VAVRPTEPRRPGFRREISRVVPSTRAAALCMDEYRLMSYRRDLGRAIRRSHLAGLAAATTAVALALTAVPASAWAPPDRPDWTQYQDNLAGSGDNRTEHALNPRTIATLHPDWVVTGGGSVSAQPLVVDGVVYWGSWDGVMHATSVR